MYYWCNTHTFFTGVIPVHVLLVEYLYMVFLVDICSMFLLYNYFSALVGILVFMADLIYQDMSHLSHLSDMLLLQLFL